jgi:hypothetical protein
MNSSSKVSPLVRRLKSMDGSYFFLENLKRISMLNNILKYCSDLIFRIIFKTIAQLLSLT